MCSGRLWARPLRDQGLETLLPWCGGSGPSRPTLMSRIELKEAPLAANGCAAERTSGARMVTAPPAGLVSVVLVRRVGRIRSPSPGW